ncbi:MAG: ATP phosphoribosyltransferase regulatory subunit [Clostridia bacterium]|nr:ATP phosphoribosyltransferase regulatory subunit [Clostridia bacterium]
MNIAETILQNDEKAVYRLRSLYRSYGYTPYKMSKFEEYDLYVRNKDFLVSDSVITFTDKSGKLMALKPDVTLSIIKNNKDVTDGVQKLCYNENVYRISDENGSYKEIMQTGLECIGQIDTYCLCEALSLAAQSLGAIVDDFILDVSHLGIVSAVLDSLKVSPEGRAALLRCIGEKNPHGISEICCRESVPSDGERILRGLIAAYGEPASVMAKLDDLLPAELAKEERQQLRDILSVLGETRIRLDFSVVQDMNYYNGIVFKGFVRGIPTAILSGGQYDRLMERMGRKSGAIGFAVYLDLLKDLSKAIADYDVDTLVLYDDKTPAAKIAETVESLIRQGKRAAAQRSVPEKITYREIADLRK